VCLLVVPGCPTAPVRNPALASTQLKLGQDYFNRALGADTAETRERYLMVALSELRKAVKADDENREAQFLLGLLYLYKGQKVIEDTELLQCVTGAEASEFHRETTKWMRLSQRHFQRVMALRKDRDSATALNLSTLYLHFKDYAKAESFARRALEDIGYPTPHLARNNIGRAQFEQGHFLRALKNLKHAVFSQRRFCPGFYWLGRVEWALNKYQEAIEAFKKSLECCREEKVAPIQEAQLYLGLAYLKIGQHANATPALEQCVKLAPKSCVARQCAMNLKTGSKP
jgi:Tfp pilus assembly protein PilF